MIVDKMIVQNMVCVGDIDGTHGVVWRGMQIIRQWSVRIVITEKSPVCEEELFCDIKRGGRKKKE